MECSLWLVLLVVALVLLLGYIIFSYVFYRGLKRGVELMFGLIMFSMGDMIDKNMYFKRERDEEGEQKEEGKSGGS